MSSKLLIRKIYDHNDFKNADRIGKLRLHLLDSKRFKIKTQDSEYLNSLKKVFHIMSEELSDAIVINRIQSEVRENTNTAYASTLINDTKRLFGDIIETNKKFDRMRLREQFIVMYQKLKDDKQWNEARLTLRNIMELDGLHLHDIDSIDPADFEIGDVIFVTDPKVLQQNEETSISESETG